MDKRRPGARAKEMALNEWRRNPVLNSLSRVFGVDREERAWWKGYKGERFVGRRLDKLPVSKWLVRHDLPLGSSGWNLDHLVVGLSGVFAINTKYLNGRVLVKPSGVIVNGHRTEFIEVARSEADQVSRRLSKVVGREVIVHPVVAIVAEEFRHNGAPQDVAVIRGGSIESHFFTDMVPTMAAAELAPIRRAAQGDAIWKEDLPGQVRRKPGFSRSSRFLPPSEMPPANDVKPGLTTTRWKRFGHDRLYFNDAKGSEAACYNVQTRELQVSDPQFDSAVRTILKQFLKENGLDSG